MPEHWPDMSRALGSVQAQSIINYIHFLNWKIYKPPNFTVAIKSSSSDFKLRILVTLSDTQLLLYLAHGNCARSGETKRILSSKSNIEMEATIKKLASGKTLGDMLINNKFKSPGTFCPLWKSRVCMGGLGLGTGGLDLWGYCNICFLWGPQRLLKYKHDIDKHNFTPVTFGPMKVISSKTGVL